jgi:hypothetical protein
MRSGRARQDDLAMSNWPVGEARRREQAMNDSRTAPITRHLEIESLQEAVRWPDASHRSITVLASPFLGSRRDQDGYAYLRERAEARSYEPLFLALEGLFQARLAGQTSLFRRRS